MNLNNLSIVAVGRPGLGIFGLPCCILKDCVLSWWISALVVYPSEAENVFLSVTVILTELLAVPCVKSDKLNKVHL